MIRYLIPLLLLTGCVNLTPSQEALLHSPEPPIHITAAELRALLPAFAEIPDGEYTLVPRGTMPTEVWSNPFAHEVFRPKDWNCQDYAHWANDQMPEDAAFGIASNPEHMLNWFVDTEKNVLLYEPQTYNFTRMDVNHIEI